MVMARPLLLQWEGGAESEYSPSHKATAFTHLVAVPGEVGFASLQSTRFGLMGGIDDPDLAGQLWRRPPRSRRHPAACPSGGELRPWYQRPPSWPGPCRGDATDPFSAQRGGHHRGDGRECRSPY